MPSGPSNLLEPPPHPHSPSRLLGQTSLESLLDEATAPNADLDQIAKSHDLTRADLAAILESPEAQPLLASLRNLYAIHHEFQACHHSLTLAQTLLESARAASNPTDKRLAATAALRALYPKSRVGNHAEGAPNPTPGLGRPGAPASTPPDAPPAAQPRRRPTSGLDASSPTPPTAATPPTSPSTPVAAHAARSGTGHSGPLPSSPIEHAEPPPSPTPRAAAVRPQDPGPTHPRTTSHQRPHSVSSSLHLSVSSPSPLDRALNRRRPRIETLTRAGAPPDTS